MSDSESCEWSGSTAAAWVVFQARLADHLAEMLDDDQVVFELESPDERDAGVTPYVQLCAWDDDRLRCEAVSNHYLAPLYQLDAKSEGELVALGFQEPTWAPEEEPDAGSSNFWVDGFREDADRFAVMAVTALRDVYGVPHPAFLTGPPLVDAGPREEVPSAGAPRRRWVTTTRSRCGVTTGAFVGLRRGHVGG